MSRHLLNSISSSIIWVRHVCGVYVCVCQWLTYTMMIQPAQPSVIAAIAESCQWTVMIRIPSVWPFMAKKSYFSISFFARLIKVAPLSLSSPSTTTTTTQPIHLLLLVIMNRLVCVWWWEHQPTHFTIIIIESFIFIVLYFFFLVLFGWSHFFSFFISRYFFSLVVFQ